MRQVVLIVIVYGKIYYKPVEIDNVVMLELIQQLFKVVINLKQFCHALQMVNNVKI